MVGMRFNTIGVSDGISMGTDGMSYSLQSRDLIADSHRNRDGRAVVRRPDRAPRLRQEHARLPDGDGPAQPPGAHGLRRHDQAGLHAAAIAKLDIVSAFQSYGEFIAGKITDEERDEIVRAACPGAGACGGMYTANTMASRDRSAGHVAALQLVDSRRRSAQARRVRRRRARRSATARKRHQAARHHDARRVRERDGRS